MSRCLLVFTIVTLGLPATLAAQSGPVRQGAHVRVVAPVFGTGLLPGRFAMARVRGRTCLGVALEKKDPAGNPMFVLLKGITRLDVDRRTNQDYAVLGLPEPADSDWVPVPAAELLAADSACRRPSP